MSVTSTNDKHAVSVNWVTSSYYRSSYQSGTSELPINHKIIYKTDYVFSIADVFVDGVRFTMMPNGESCRLVYSAWAARPDEQDFRMELTPDVANKTVYCRLIR